MYFSLFCNDLGLDNKGELGRIVVESFSITPDSPSGVLKQSVGALLAFVVVRWEVLEIVVIR